MSLIRRTPRACTLAALALAACAPALGSPIETPPIDGPSRAITYSTEARFDAFGPWSLPGVAFEGVRGGTVDTAPPFATASFPWELPDGSTVDFPLGRLVIDAPSQGAVQGGGTFQIEVRIEAVDGVTLADPLLVAIQGFASGVLRADGESSVHYGVVGYELHPPYTPPLPVAGGFDHDGLHHGLLIPDGSHGVATFSSDGSLPLDARLISSRLYHNPEPATWIGFAAVGLAASRLRPARKRSGR